MDSSSDAIAFKVRALDSFVNSKQGGRERSDLSWLGRLLKLGHERTIVVGRPYGHAFTWPGCFWTKLAHSFLSHLCVYFCLPESLTHPSFYPSTSSDISEVFSLGLPFLSSPAFQLHFTLSKSAFCHFPFSLRSSDSVRWPSAATRDDGGWDPDSCRYCWAVALC